MKNLIFLLVAMLLACLAPSGAQAVEFVAPAAPSICGAYVGQPWEEFRLGCEVKGYRVVADVYHGHDAAVLEYSDKYGCPKILYAVDFVKDAAGSPLEVMAIDFLTLVNIDDFRLKRDSIEARALLRKLFPRGVPERVEEAADDRVRDVYLDMSCDLHLVLEYGRDNALIAARCVNAAYALRGLGYFLSKVR